MPGERPCIVGAVLLQQPSKRPLMDKFFKVNRVLHTSYVGVLLLYILGMSPSFWFIIKAKSFSTRQFVTFKVGKLSLYVSNFVLVKNSWYMIPLFRNKGFLVNLKPREMLQNLLCLWKKKTYIVFFLFHLKQLSFPLMNALVYVDIDQGIHKGKW